jgi:hypothetical protein
MARDAQQRVSGLDIPFGSQYGILAAKMNVTIRFYQTE